MRDVADAPAEAPADGGGGRIRIGVGVFPTGDGLPPAQLAAACEERGVESLWVTEHTHIPTSRASPWPGGPELPGHYLKTYDPFVTLAVAAAVTSRLRLGTGVCLVVERDPIVLAKEVASLDVVSGGRFLFGVGAGWNLEEMRNHGTDPSTRFALLRERVEAMTRIWTEDEPAYHGHFVDFDPIWSWPKPRQRPRPPVILGGGGPRVLERVIAYADGWMPMHGRGADIAALAARIRELGERAAAAGRPHPEVSVFGVPLDAEAVDAYRAIGVDRAIVLMPSRAAEVVLPRLDRLAELIAA